jgi:hypothetical protein
MRGCNLAVTEKVAGVLNTQVQGAANVYEVQVLEDIQRIDQVLAR